MRSLVALGLVAAFLIGGCASESVDVDRGFGLVDDLGVHSIIPPEFTPGELTTLTLFCDTEYAGLARVLVTGHGGGNDVGELKTPVEALVGSVLFLMPMDAGRMLIPLEIEMLLDYDYVAFSVQVTLDSLLVDDSFVHWQSDEGRDLYEDDIPPETAFVGNTSYIHVGIDRAESE